MSTVFNTLPYSGRQSRTYEFPDPFLDMASVVMPNNIRDVIDLCEFVWLKNGTYRRAASRIARYFITAVDTEGLADWPATITSTHFVAKVRCALLREPARIGRPVQA